MTALDIDSGNNSVVRYSLAGRGSQSFVIDPETGEVRVSAIGVDFDTIPENPLQLIVIASDLGMLIVASSPGSPSPFLTFSRARIFRV